MTIREFLESIAIGLVLASPIIFQIVYELMGWK
jgi:hypothetical protein